MTTVSDPYGHAEGTAGPLGRHPARSDGGIDIGWIWSVNLRPFVEILSREVGYAFDESDWVAIEHGLAGTDREQGQWFDYPIGRLTVSVAYEPDADEMVSVRIDGDLAASQTRIVWLAGLAQELELRRRRT